MADRDPGPLPSRWLKCPRKSSGLIAQKFLAFKTPLGSKFNDIVPESNRFTPSMLFDYMKSLKMTLGLWIDLTNTTRFYDRKEVEKMGCKYVKLACRGHGETPSPDQTKEFISVVYDFIAQNPLAVVGVHCTHGFNRTGFLITCYMVEKMDWSVDAALAMFATKREPGVYKQDYLLELYKLYDDESMVPEAPPRPDWCDEEEQDYDDDDVPTVSHGNGSNQSGSSKPKKRRKETNFKKDCFMPGVKGVEPFDTQPRFREVQQKVQEFCKWTSTGFPGSQPVSMDKDNIKLLQKMPYMVSWKADGVRFMMLIEDEDEVYMLDRDNCAFKVHGLRFLHNKLGHHLRDTLLDGEMVVDNVNGETIHRYLCYDIIRFEGMNVGKEPFFPVRMNCIEKEIINPRNRAIKCGALNKESEPFRVVAKGFWAASLAQRLLADAFERTLAHEPDGLIFQPANDPYVPGECAKVLKWKPSELNSIDFRLEIFVESGEGILKRSVGGLYVGGHPHPIATIKLTRRLRELNGKIIECKYAGDDGFQFMRERTDKTFPNSYKTAMAVMKSISNPVTKEYLLDFIAKQGYRDRHDMGVPPKRPRL